MNRWLIRSERADARASHEHFLSRAESDLARSFPRSPHRSSASAGAHSAAQTLIRACVRQPFDAAAWAVLGLVFVLVCATFRVYGVAWDEQGETVYGTLLLKYYQSWFHDHSAFEFLNLRYYGGGFELPAAILSRISPFGEYETRHLLSALLGIVALAATWRLGRAIGGPRAGLLALLLLVLNPSWYGHIFINARDVPFAAGMSCCLLLSLRALDELPRIHWRTSVLFGLALGWTVSVRVGGLLAFGFLLVPIALWFAARARQTKAVEVRAGARERNDTDLARHALRAAGSLLGALAVAYALMSVLWPWAVQSPLNPFEALSMFSRFPFEGSVLFEGQQIPARALPASYLPVLLAIKQPEVLLVGLAGSLLLGVYALYRRARERRVEARASARERNDVESARVLTLAVAAAFPILYFMVARPVAYNGMRHFLFLLPPLSALAALAFDRAIEGLRERRLRLALGLSLALVGVFQVRALVVLFPHQYVYFNSLVGGTAGAQGRYELDYWGTSLGEASERLVRALEQRRDLPAPGQPPFKVYVCGNVWSAALAFPPWLTPVERIEDADFQIAIAEFFCKHPPGSGRVLDVRRDGAVLSFVDDLRVSPSARPGIGFAQARPPAKPSARADDRSAPAGPPRAADLKRVPQRQSEARSVE